MKLLKYICTGMAFLLLSGCVREIMEECWRVELCFRYMYDGEDLFSEKIKKLNLYIFNEEQLLVDEKEFRVEDLQDGRTLPQFRLRPGKYTAVALGNKFENTEVVGLENHDLKKIFIQHPETDRSQDISTYDKNYLGSTSFDLGAVTVLRDTVDMQLSHMNLYVEVTGIRNSELSEEVRGGESAPYRMKIENVNARTDFTNAVSREFKTVCIPKLLYDSQTGTISTEVITLFRFEKVCDHVLKLYDMEGREVAAVSLGDYIKDHPELISTVTPEIEIPLEIEFCDLEVSVKVPDWVTVEVHPDL